MMTIKQLQTELSWALNECKTKEEEITLLATEIKVRFDFPIHGRVETYKLVSFNKDRSLTIYNGGVERPQGHK